MFTRSFHVVYMLAVLCRPAVGYVRCVCCLCVATFGGTRMFDISLFAMSMLILCLFRGGGVDLPTSRGREHSSGAERVRLGQANLPK